MYHHPNINKTYYSKILLFGEYTVTLGSGGLALPYTKKGGTWDYKKNDAEPIDGLNILLHYLKKNKKYAEVVDLGQFQNDIKDGLIFKSNVPIGYGLGSSGTLVAGFYDRYCNEPEQDLKKLKSILAEMESAFHGSSSGLDPLVSYLNEAVLIKDDGYIYKKTIEYQDRGFFMVDTGIPRKTEDQIHIFKNKMAQSKAFVNAVNALAIENFKAINGIIAMDMQSLTEAMKNISLIQLEYFIEMIPPSFRKLWKDGLKSNDYYLKLCGAGGGGMILGLKTNTNSFDFSKQMFGFEFL